MRPSDREPVHRPERIIYSLVRRATDEARANQDRYPQDDSHVPEHMIALKIVQGFLQMAVLKDMEALREQAEDMPASEYLRALAELKAELP